MDLETVTRPLDEVRNVRAFERWARDWLPRHVGHHASMFGFAVRHALGFAIEQIIAVELPADYLRSISGPAGTLMCPILYDWFRTHEPQLFDSNEPLDAHIEPRWAETFRDFDLRRLAVHGHTSPCGRVVTFFGLYRLAGDARDDRDRIRSIAVPIHEALLRVCAPESADPSEGEVQRKVTEREMEIVRWLAAGKTNWEVGQILGISDLTVKSHVQRLLNKTGTKSRTQMVAQIMRSEAAWTAGPHSVTG